MMFLLCKSCGDFSHVVRKVFLKNGAGKLKLKLHGKQKGFPKGKTAQCED